MKYKSHILITLLLPALFFSCQLMYVPNMQNVPAMQKKGDLSVTASVANYQASYALTDHFGILANGYYRKYRWEDIFDGNNHDVTTIRKLFEAGAGYYNHFYENTTFEVFGGIGLGHTEWEKQTYLSSSTDYKVWQSSFKKFFIQPDISFRNDFFDIAFSTRLAGVMFDRIRYLNYTESELKTDELYLLENKLYYFLEPAITLRLGYKLVKIHAQFIYSELLNKEEISRMPFAFNVGLVINLNTLLLQEKLN